MNGSEPAKAIKTEERDNKVATNGNKKEEEHNTFNIRGERGEELDDLGSIISKWKGHTGEDGRDIPQMLSFPWIVGDVLVRIKKNKWNKCPMPSFQDKLQESMMSHTRNCEMEMLPAFLERDRIRGEVELCVQVAYPQEHVYLFGSSSFMLFVPNSDIDLTFSASSPQLALKRVFESCKEIFSGIQLMAKQEPPILRYCGEQFSFDISVGLDAHQKSLLLRRYLVQ